VAEEGSGLFPICLKLALILDTNRNPVMTGLNRHTALKPYRVTFPGRLKCNAEHPKRYISGEVTEWLKVAVC
jgi:hypothetical protein